MNAGSPTDRQPAAGIGAPVAQPWPAVATAGGAAAAGSGSVRIHAFDWLRAAAVIGIVIYHSLLPFGLRDWHVNNGERSELLTAGLLVFETFGLGLLFLLAGASARFALRTRSNRQFLSERTARLLVPFAFWTLLLTPLTMYVTAVQDGGAPDSFLAYLASWPAGAIGWIVDTGFTPRLFGIGFHLWFLGFLFALSVLALPVFRWLSGEGGRSFEDALGKAARWPGSSLLFFLPTMLPPLFLLPPAPDQFEWWQFGWYGAYFLTGYVLFLDEKWSAAIRRDVAPAIVVAIVASAGLIAADFTGWVAAHDDAPYVYDVTLVLMIFLYALAGWAWTIAVLGGGLRARRLQRPLPERVGEAVLPIYILHQPIVVAVSFVVVGLSVGLAVKAALIVVVGLAATVAVVELALRVPVIRTLLGARRPGPQVGAPAGGVVRSEEATVAPTRSP
ncbi:MAG: acyltransferase 3 [Chloroflexi bacterium]|nr:acyltransferase 3 [Chloroflexota bacterium]